MAVARGNTKMKIKITVPQILAKNITHPRTDPDEIYLAYFITLAKVNKEVGSAEVRRYAVKQISEVKNKVKKNTRWGPSGLETILDTGDAEALYLTMALYEYDNGTIYKELVTTSDVLINPNEFDWECIEIPADLKNWFAWIKSVWKLVVGVYNYFRQDDLLGDYSIVIPLTQEAIDSGWDGSREIKFKRFGGDYRVSLMLEVVKEE